MARCPTCTQTVAFAATTCAACGATFNAPSLGILESRLSAEAEAAVPIPRAVSRILGFLAVGGAAWGFIAIALGLSHNDLKPSTIAIATAMASFFAFSGYCGVQTLRRNYGWLRLSQVLWAVQIPVVTTPVFSYALSTGAFATLWLQFLPHFRFGAYAWLGSLASVSVFTSNPVALGANVLALAVTIYLARVQRNA